MNQAPKPTISVNWHLVDSSLQRPAEEAASGIKALNSQTLVVPSRYVSNVVVSLVFPVLVVGIILMLAMHFRGLSPTSIDSTDPMEMVGAVLDQLGVVWMWALVAGGVWLSYIAFVRPLPSSLVVNRKHRKVYGSYNAVPVELDWSRVTPVITQGVLLAGGMKTLYNLMLVQFEEGKEPHRKTAERGIIISTGHISMGECATRWEYLRTYMGEAPEKLPETTIAPNDGWVGKVLEDSLYGELHDTTQLVSQLRERQGVPVFNHWMSLFIFVFGPAMLLNLYQTFLQRQTKLPETWLTTTTTSEPNPYKLIIPDANDMALRRKAAGSVALWLAVCIGSGCAAWAWIIYLIAR